MNIQSEIREYILSHDFVMLPGIGAFVAEYSQPYFDKNGEIVPSERKLRFNPLLRNDSDVDILQVFKERMHISDEEVQEQYFNFLDTVNEQLGAFNRYYWEGFGILLSEGPGSVLQFLPFHLSENSEEPSTEGVVLSQMPAPMEENPGTEVIAEDAAEEIYEEEYEEEPGGNKAMKYLIFALPLALLTAALVYMVFFKPSQGNHVKEEGASWHEADLNGEEVTIDTLYMEPAAAEVVVSAPEEHVVRVGIYKWSKDADKIVAFLAGKGYEAKIRPHGSLFKVYLVAETEDQAIRYIKEVERLIDDTPIYERKKSNG